jgi:hypothetical protein
MLITMVVTMMMTVIMRVMMMSGGLTVLHLFINSDLIILFDNETYSS